MKRKRNRKESNYRKSKLNRWNKLLFKDYDWDYDYLLKIEYLKLSEMLEYFKYSQIVETDLIVRDLKLALSLLDIISGKTNDLHNFKDGKIIPTSNIYINTKNSKRFLPTINFSRTDDAIFLFKEELRHEKAWHLYNLLRYYRMQTWWD